MALINGRGYRSFKNEDLHKILTVLDGVGDLKSINARIREACHSYLLSIDRKQSKEIPTTAVSENRIDKALSRDLTISHLGLSHLTL